MAKVYTTLLLSTLLLLSGCAPKVQTQFLVAPEHPRVYQHQNIALLDYTGRGGQTVTQELEQTLSQIKIRGIPYFELRRTQKKRPRRLSTQSAIHVGRHMGVDAIHFGQVTDFSWQDRPYRMNRERWCKRPYHGRKRTKDQYQACLYGQNKPTNKPFKPHEVVDEIEVIEEDITPGRKKKVKQRRIRKITTRRPRHKVTTPVICRKRDAQVEIHAKVAEVHTEALIYSQSHRASRSVQRCPGDRNSQLTAGHLLLQQALRQTLKAYRQDIAPYLRAVSIPLMEEGKGLTPRGLKILKQGVEFANNQRLDTACKLWRDSLAQEPAPNASLLYNIGVCHEVEGDLEQAQTFYQQAEIWLGKPHTAISKGIKRVTGGLQRM
ncbi:tetratricopeptide repeat protein [Magnetococcus sp. PR-3]|uniref:tetratricopeptide repeat protein n=1 Tax=Magnetococcus sp. PR-3 TaxID=3120355 RepID=UPI002FCE3036